LAVANAAAFGQGKVAFANDSLHLVYYDPNPLDLRPADAALAGQGVDSANMPAGVTLVADLYAGSSSTSLSLVSTTTFSVTIGRFALVNLVLPNGLPGGTAHFFQVQIRDNAFASADASAAAGSYSGESTIFTMVPGSSIVYNSIVSPGTPGSSTWAPGAFDMSAQSGLSGARGVILVSGAIPEPCGLALWLLGIGLLVRRSLRR
jgi:hypothetical protein